MLPLSPISHSLISVSASHVRKWVEIGEIKNVLNSGSAEIELEKSFAIFFTLS